MRIACDIVGEPQCEAIKTPKQKRSQTQKATQGTKVPAPHATPPEATLEQARCTRYGTMHPIRGTAPDQKRCIAYGSGAAPQHTRTNAELASEPLPTTTSLSTGRQAGTGRVLGSFVVPSTHTAPERIKQPRPRPTGIGTRPGLGRSARSAYSLTPPAVRPETMYFCRYWNSRITGTAAITEPAAKIPHGAVRSSAAHMYMPTARVNWL